MNKYTTLESILNKCIEKGRKPFGVNNIYKISYMLISCIVEQYAICSEGKPFDIGHRVSINDLFSVDSGLIKFVEWKGVDHEWCRNPVEERGGGIGGESYYGTSTDSYDRKRFHLLEMSDLTAEEKVDYFLKNIIDD